MWALKQYLFLVPTDPSICTTATEACDPQESKEQSCEEKHFCPCGNSTLIATICPWCLSLAWFSPLRVGIYGQNCRLHFLEGGNLWPELQTPRPPELSFCRSLRTQFFTTFSWATDLLISSACVCTRSLQVVPSSLWPDGLQSTSLLCPWGSSRQEYWSGLPCPDPENLPYWGLNPCLLHLLHCRWFLYPLIHWGSPRSIVRGLNFKMIKTNQKNNVWWLIVNCLLSKFKFTGVNLNDSLCF